MGDSHRECARGVAFSQHNLPWQADPLWAHLSTTPVCVCVPVCLCMHSMCTPSPPPTLPHTLLHATQVDWWPWCDEAIKAAREQDKPIFLSVGYATCHWWVYGVCLWCGEVCGRCAGGCGCVCASHCRCECTDPTSQHPDNVIACAHCLCTLCTLSCHHTPNMPTTRSPLASGRSAACDTTQHPATHTLQHTPGAM